MSKIIREINILLALRNLFAIFPNHPINLGKSFVIGFLFLKAVQTKKKDFKILHKNQKMTPLDYYKKLFIYAAGFVELNSLFYSFDITNIISDIIADILRAANVKKTQIFIYEKTNKRFEKMQGFLTEINIFGAGRCYNYAALSLYHLLDLGIRPVDALWLKDPNYSSENKQRLAGHQIIAIGLKTDDEYKNLRQSEAIIFDFWAGTILSASDYFRNPRFTGYEHSIIQSCRIRENENNPFSNSVHKYYELIKTWKIDTAKEIVQIFNLRKDSQEKIQDFHLDENWRNDSRRLNANVLDLEYNQREEAIKQNLSKLSIFNLSAIKIQKQYKYFLKNKSGKSQNLGSSVDCFQYTISEENCCVDSMFKFSCAYM